MIVCLDSGNSRIKWGVHDGRTWLAQEAVGHDRVGELASLPRAWPMPERVMIANVAGAEALVRIVSALAPWRAVITEVHSAVIGGGVTNGYLLPERLGVDRWCALIGAWHHSGMPTVVVMAGTATTIDSLDARGNFLGGLILPGIDLMLRSLAKGTADLPFAAGQHTDFPRCTDDAIASGVLEAQLGAIERARQRLGDGVACLVSGGNGERLLPHLSMPCRLLPNLPLEGLVRLALDDDQ